MDELMSEKEQWEAVQRWLRENILWMLGGVAVALGAYGGYQWYVNHREAQYAAAANTWQELMGAYAKGDVATVETKTDELVAHHADTGYADQAQLALASMQVDNGNADKALPMLLAVMQGSRDAELRLVARLRAARVQLDQKHPDEALATLNGSPAGAFAASFAEVRGDILYAKGDRAGALKAYLDAQHAAASGGSDSDLLKLKINELSHT